MRRLRKFVSLVTIGAMAVVPVLSVGCGDGATAPAPKTESTTTAGTKAAATDGKSPEKKSKKKKKPSTTTAESGSTTGAGVKPPVK